MTTMTVELPDGIDAEKAKKIIAAHQTRQNTQYKVGKAKREAVSALIKKYKTEYDQLLAAAKKRHGVS